MDKNKEEAKYLSFIEKEYKKREFELFSNITIQNSDLDTDNVARIIKYGILSDNHGIIYEEVELSDNLLQYYYTNNIPFCKVSYTNNIDFNKNIWSSNKEAIYNNIQNQYQQNKSSKTIALEHILKPDESGDNFSHRTIQRYISDIK